MKHKSPGVPDLTFILVRVDVLVKAPMLAATRDLNDVELSHTTFILWEE